MKPDDPNSANRSFQTVDMARGIVITAIMAIVGYVAWPAGPKAAQDGPTISTTGIQMLLVAAGMQAVLLFGRPLMLRFERAHGLEGQLSPWLIHVVQLLADGVTVLLFALAVFGSIARFTEAV
jgi:hypothetical protein